MGRQSKLVLLLLLSIVGVISVTRASTPHPRYVHDEVEDNDLDSSENFLDEISSKAHNLNKVSGIKISTPKVKDVPSDESTSTKASIKKSLTPAKLKSVNDEVLNDLLEAAKHNAALADDERFHNLLQTQNVTANKNSSEENYDDYDTYDYDEDYNYDNEETTSVKPKKAKDTSTTALPKLLEIDAESGKPKTKDGKSSKNVKLEDDFYGEDDDEEDDDDEDDDDEEDDLGDEEEIVFSENVPCPRYCVCARNINSYLVATCSRLDTGTQKFGSDITDVVVTDVGPKYPILLGPKFFYQLGLKNVASIKIANCTIEYMHPEAFHGLEELYAVNLTNVGLGIINPETFSQNRKLRMLTISGNDLNVMSSVHYLLNSASIEELDLSRNNLMELNPKAFSKLSNVVYINLSQNGLQKIPEGVFDTVETIEELDLSYNSLKELPHGIFNRTALAILHLQYNNFTGDLGFGTSDLQQLDLSFNWINQVKHGMFDKMTGLTNLNLKGNGITKIQPESFLYLKNLRHIDLSVNELDQISSMLFYKNSELDVIRLHDNAKLSQLPTDGFVSYNGYFTVYLLDVSNCALSSLGHRTFSTMPHLTTLKLAWNNINNLERDTFASLRKLIELDLSSNLISKLDELIFMENNELTKLNLAGNPIRSLSVRLFLPLNKLRELDVSDCELSSLMSDKEFGTDYKFFDTLRSFNASANQIKTITVNDVKSFKNLRSLDITNNPLKCNTEFQEFISYVALRTHMLPMSFSTLASFDENPALEELQAPEGWAKLAHGVCKHSEDRLEKEIEKAGEELDKDARELLETIEKNKISKMHNIMKDSRKKEPVTDDILDKSLEEEDINNGGETTEDDDDELSESNYDDDDDDDNDEGDYDIDNDNDGKDMSRIYEDFDKFEKEHGNMDQLPKLKDFGITVQEVDLNKDNSNKKLLDKFGLDKQYDEDANNDDEEEVIIERGHIYYSGYKFMIPIIIVVTCVVIILICIAKLVAWVVRKRGDRYRMALLASTKNSIVYQKLTEDIVKPTSKESKQPKVHRYAPINQV